MEGASLELEPGENADFVLFGSRKEGEIDAEGFRRRKTLQETVHDPILTRVTIKSGFIAD